MGRGAAGSPGGAEQSSRKAVAQAKLDRAVREQNAVAIVKLDMNGDGVAESTGFDTNGDGIVDAFDTDGDGKIDMYIDPQEHDKTSNAAGYKTEHKWQAARHASGGKGDLKGDGVMGRRAFGLLSGMKRREDRHEERLNRLAEAQEEAGFAASLFDGAQHRIQMVDNIYMHMLDDQSASVVLQHAVALQQSLGKTIRDLEKKTVVTKSARSIASMYPDDPAKEKAQKQKKRQQEQQQEEQQRAAGWPAAAASAPDLSAEPQPETAVATASEEVQAPRPPSGKRQGAPARRQAAAASTPALARPDSSDRDADTDSRVLTVTMSDRDLLEADRLREKQRARLKDERNKVLQATVKEKQAAIGEATEKQRELTRQIQKLTQKLHKKDGQLRSIQDLHRETENELLNRVDQLEGQLSTGRHGALGGDQGALVSVSAGGDAMALTDELQVALSRLMSTQEALQVKEADLTNSKKKVKVLKDKVALLERKNADMQAAQEDSAQEIKSLQAKASRIENKLRESAARVRQLEEEANSKSTEALQLQALVHHANDELKGRDEQGASLAAKLQKAVDAVGQKADEMERLKALLAVAHAENEKALELEHEVSKERRKALKCKKDAERAEAKLAASDAKLSKRILEIDELKLDLSNAEKRVAAADKRVAQAKADMMTKNAVIDKASADTNERLRALRDAEQEIRDLHAALDRHDHELADRDAKVAEAEEAVTAAWKYAKKGIQNVKVDAAKQIAAVQDMAKREVQKIKSDNVADEMLQSSFEAVKEADEQAQMVRNELKLAVVEAEKHRNTSVALLAHLEVSRAEREQLTEQIRHYQDMLSKMFASVTEAAALKAELEQSQATVRTFRMRHAVAMTRMEGLEEQVRVLRDEEESETEEFDDEHRRAEELAAATKVLEGDRARLTERVREWMLMEADMDKIKGQKNKALEKARQADELSGNIQREMIRSVAHATLDKIASDIEIRDAKAAQIKAEEAEARAQGLADELNAETSQILEMLDAEKAGRARLEDNLQHQIEDRELLMASMQQTNTAMSGVQQDLDEREERLSILKMELDEAKAQVGASHAREDALRQGMNDLRSVRVVDYIMSRPDLCPAALVTGHTNAKAFVSGGAAAAHAMVEAVKDAIAAYNKLVKWQQLNFELSGKYSRPVPDEVNAWSGKLGVSPEHESGLLWVVEEAISAPIAKPWVEKIKDVEGELLEDRIYYVHTESGVERLEHPLKDHYLALLAALRNSEASMTNSFDKMRHGLASTPPTELVKEAWQEWVEECLTELFQLAVQRHQIVHKHYSDIAEVVGSDPEAQMTQILRAKRPSAKGNKRKPVASDASSKVGVSVEFKAQSDAARLETIMRNQSELAAAIDIVGAVPANSAMLRVRSVGSLAKCGNLMIGGGSLLDHESSEPTVQWFRSKHSVNTSAGQTGVAADDFEPVPRARSLSYTPSALDAGRLLRLVVSPGEGQDAVWAAAGSAAVMGDANVETKAHARVETGVVRETLRAARTGETRTILVQRGESSRVEVRNGDGAALLEIAMGLVVFDQSYDFADSIALVHVETGLPLKESTADTPDPGDGTAIEGPPVVLQLSSSALRDEVLLALRGLQQHDGTMELLDEDKA